MDPQTFRLPHPINDHLFSLLASLILRHQNIHLFPIHLPHSQVLHCRPPYRLTRYHATLLRHLIPIVLSALETATPHSPEH